VYGANRSRRPGSRRGWRHAWLREGRRPG
jgi:hypothetical protein